MNWKTKQAARRKIAMDIMSVIDLKEGNLYYVKVRKAEIRGEAFFVEVETGEVGPEMVIVPKMLVREPVDPDLRTIKAKLPEWWEEEEKERKSAVIKRIRGLRRKAIEKMDRMTFDRYDLEVGGEPRARRRDYTNSVKFLHEVAEALGEVIEALAP